MNHLWSVARTGTDTTHIRERGACQVDLYACQRVGCRAELGMVRTRGALDMTRYRAMRGAAWSTKRPPCEAGPKAGE